MKVEIKKVITRDIALEFKNATSVNIFYIDNNNNLQYSPHRVNDFLKNVPNITFVKESDKNHLLGQAYGLRAFYYYTLLKTWGDVPIILEPLATVDPATLAKERAPQTEVMAQIKSDYMLLVKTFSHLQNILVMIQKLQQEMILE